MPFACSAEETIGKVMSDAGSLMKKSAVVCEVRTVHGASVKEIVLQVCAALLRGQVFAINRLRSLDYCGATLACVAAFALQHRQPSKPGAPSPAMHICSLRAHCW